MNTLDLSAKRGDSRTSKVTIAPRHSRRRLVRILDRPAFCPTVCLPVHSFLTHSCLSSVHPVDRFAYFQNHVLIVNIVVATTLNIGEILYFHLLFLVREGAEISPKGDFVLCLGWGTPACCYSHLYFVPLSCHQVVTRMMKAAATEVAASVRSSWWFCLPLVR